MSGPVGTDDVQPAAGTSAGTDGPVVEVEPGRLTQVGSLPVRRVLPQRPRRTVGSWCFADHVGPVPVHAGGALGIGPHPHMGLQTVTWLVSGELLHLDGLGSEQLIRPGQLNLMTAGHGVAHAEEDPGRAGELHAVQLWVAQPEATRNGRACLRAPCGAAPIRTCRLGGHRHGGRLRRARVTGAGATSQHMGVELTLQRPGGELPLRADYEHALVVLEGSVAVGGTVAKPGALAYLGRGREECSLEVEAPARALLLGGLPFPEPVLMWWNFVGRTPDELSEARRQWTEDDGRFGRVRSSLERIEVGRPPWE